MFWKILKDKEKPMHFFCTYQEILGFYSDCCIEEMLIKYVTCRLRNVKSLQEAKSQILMVSINHLNWEGL